MKTIAQAARDLRQGRTTARELLERALLRIDDPTGQGSQTFMSVTREKARRQADHIDRHHDWADASASPLCGIPLSIKDVFDVAGEVTRAGSAARESAKVATADADAVVALKRAGGIILGRTTMSEFAFSGIGINSNYGTPLNPWDRQVRRIAGGSSSGSAVSVADGMALGALATDTGGSIRAPAALCGLTGFKPSRAAVSLKGMFPRSYSLDTVGPIANSVSCCRVLFEALSGLYSAAQTRPRSSESIIHLGLIDGEPLDRLSPEVREAFDAAISRLSTASVRITLFPMPEISRIRAVTSGTGISPPEAYTIHRQLLETNPEKLNPIFRARLMRAREARASDYIAALQERERIKEDAALTTAPFDALLMPTCPILAPRLDQVEDNAEFEKFSALLLSNCNLANFLDRPAITLPITSPGAPPAGLMLMGGPAGDHSLLDVAQRCEAILGFRGDDEIGS